MFRISALLVILLSVSAVMGQDHESAYAGQEIREIKSLSAQERRGYLSGHGMGFAKAAELNHYPGPKHVLQLQDELGLSEQQVQKTKQVYDEMHREAIRFGKLYVQKEKDLDHLFSTRQVDEEHLLTLLKEIAALRGEVRFAHLKAHVRMKQILSEEQIAQYDLLRGYASGGTQHGGHGEH